jgi:hypothetical protein
MRKLSLSILLLLATLGAHASYFQGVETAGNDIVITSGTCPTGYTEDTALRGFYAAGNPSNGTIGNSLGSAMSGSTPPDASVTPAGSVAAPTFTGNSNTSSAVSAGTPAGTNAASTITVSAGNNVVSTAPNALAATAANATVVAPIFTGSALGTHTHTVTPTGTNSAPAFIGTANATMRSTVAPVKYVIYCKKS